MAVFEKVLGQLKEGKLIARAMLNENNVYRLSRDRGSSNSIEMWRAAEPERMAKEEVKNEEGRTIEWGCSHRDAQPAHWGYGSIDTCDILAYDWVVLGEKEITERGITE